jgi:hypothetical protein
MAPNKTALSATTVSSLNTKAATTLLRKKHLGNYVNLDVGPKYRQVISVPIALSIDTAAFACASAFRVLVDTLCEKVHNPQPVSDLISAIQQHLPVNVASARMNHFSGF